MLKIHLVKLSSNSAHIINELLIWQVQLYCDEYNYRYLIQN